MKVEAQYATGLFENPFKENLSLAHRVAIIAFHILTLGIPLSLYHAIDCCFPQGLLSYVLPCNSVRETALEKLKKSRNIAPYSDIEQAALDFAKEKLKEHADAKPFEIYKKLPVNNDILKLMSIYWDVYYDKWEKAIKANPDHPWSKKEVIEAADECMKLAFAISVMTLEDLPAFTAKLPKEEQMFSHALARQDAYMYRTFYYCTSFYHWIRGGVVAIDFDTNDCYLGFPENKLTKEEAASFYESGTRQNRWNQLYNAYCRRVRMYVSEQDMRRSYPNGDQRHANWTKVDAKFEDFSNKPDTKPT